MAKDTVVFERVLVSLTPEEFAMVRHALVSYSQEMYEASREKAVGHPEDSQAYAAYSDELEKLAARLVKIPKAMIGE